MLTDGDLAKHWFPAASKDMLTSVVLTKTERGYDRQRRADPTASRFRGGMLFL